MFPIKSLSTQADKISAVSERWMMSQPRIYRSFIRVKSLCDELEKNRLTVLTIGTNDCEQDRSFDFKAICDWFPMLLQALETTGNTSVHTVRLKEPFVEEAKTGILLSHLGYMKGLKHLEISWARGRLRRRRIWAKDLARCLRRTSSIETICIEVICAFEHGGEDLVSLNQAMQFHSTLKSLCLTNVDAASGSGKSRLELNSLLDSLATVPHLEKLELSSCALPDLGGGPSILKSNKGQIPAHILERDTTLGLLGDLKSALAISCLVEKSTKLHHLALRHCGLTNLHAHHLASVLCNDYGSCPSIRLEVLDLRSNVRITANHGQAWLVDCLILHDNFSLKEIHLDWYLSQQRHAVNLFGRMRFYTRLNRANRGLFLLKGTESRSDRDIWNQRMQILLAARDDLDVSFYFLRQDPTVVTGFKRESQRMIASQKNS
mmetsp:Transcript_32751/g.68296  ORF Transcript_32751/g.68296 Transcript_32751/m.68296 type:complete len:434 (+) Transcript_32751:2542-3843(+)